MTKCFLILSLFSITSLFAQNSHREQEIRYTIDTELNDQENSLTSFESIVYKNNASVTMSYIWFYLPPNGYKNDSTVVFREMKKDPDLKRELSRFKYGFIDGLFFQVNGRPVLTEAHPDVRKIDLIKLILPQPLSPGDSVLITTPFKVHLPSYIMAFGYSDDEFILSQWYPMPVAYEKDEWPGIEKDVYYSNFASYQVSITLPAKYVVCATGSLQTANELALYKKIGSENTIKRKDSPQLYIPSSESEKKTLTYYADRVGNFAWIADKDFIIQYDTIRVGSGKIIDAFSYYHPFKGTQWINSMDYMKDGLRHYDSWIGEYAYPVIQAVEGPKVNRIIGTAFPMISLIKYPNSDAKSLDAIIAHETGHNWFGATLGHSGHIWMIEGLNTYFEFRYQAEKYGGNLIVDSLLPADFRTLPLDTIQARIYKVLYAIPIEEAIETPRDKFKNRNELALVSYIKPAIWMYTLQSAIGRKEIDEAFKAYFEKWKFKDPGPEDMKQSFEETVGIKLDWFFDLLNKKGKFR
jgi:hypothetical protein